MVVLDVWLPGMDGLATLARMRERQVDAQVVIISGHGNVESAVRAIKMGAFDFVEKPLSAGEDGAGRPQRLTPAAPRGGEPRAARVLTPSTRWWATVRDDAPARAGGDGGADQRPRAHLRRERNGKELVARNIHALSLRRTGPFVEVNCAAIPEELIESELFGHVRGAFTGAVADRRGKFELAHGGTIFLDEIGDMSLKTQAKVLRVLQEQVMEAVGGSTRIKVDARVLAATNKDLRAEIKAGRFREDLYFRLNVVRFRFRRCASAGRRRPPRGPFHGMLAKMRPPRQAVRRRSAPRHCGTTVARATRELRNVVERLMIMVPGARRGARSAVPRSGERAGSVSRRPSPCRFCRCTMHGTISSVSTSCGR